MRYAKIKIDSHALQHNLQVIKKQLQPNTKILAMVKANAYGHGIAAVAPSLTKADGFGVACMAEALELNAVLYAQNLPNKPIVLIEGVFSQDEWNEAMRLNFSCVIHQQEQLDWALSQPPHQDGICRTIWLKFNTGMNRLGFDSKAVVLAAKQLHQAGYHLILTTHFACADDREHPLNEIQIKKFNTAFQQILKFAPNCQASLCNSAGIFNFPNQHHHWVRAGIALYGSKPVFHTCATSLNLKPAMTLSAKIMAIHHLQNKQSVGYSALWQAQKNQKIAVVSIGYGDGYPRVVHAATVSIQDAQGQRHHAQIIGRVAMDMLMIDIDNLPVKVGDEVTLWGQSPHIDEIAACAGTIGYELMCRLTNRPNRF